MGIKLALNIAYNIGIIFCVYVFYFGYQHNLYVYMAGAVFVAALIMIFKIKLIKEIKNTKKKP